MNEKAKKGSQMWLQRLVNEAPHEINRTILQSCPSIRATDIEWISPLERHGYVEYRDNAAFENLGVSPAHRPLQDFWPPRGPVWDGLARTGDGEILLIEAKAHIAEAVSPPSRATPASRAKIEAALAELKTYLGGNPDVDWSGTFYQVTNRLAFLYYLRVLNDIPAHLVFLYFVGDAEMKGPGSVDEWHGAIALLESFLGIRKHRLTPFVHHVFYDVRGFPGAS